MGRKEKFSAEVKIMSVQEYLSGSKGVTRICNELQVDSKTFRLWLRKYETLGAQGLVQIKKNTHYPESHKLQAVADYTNGKGSQEQICKAYGIPTASLLRDWIKKYNSHEKFKSHNSGGDRIMTKGRKTTYEERTEIVAFCVAHNDNYQLAAEHFQVSYQQIYAWVQKYKVQGYEALCDKRGRRKKPEELTESEKFAVQLKLLEAENRRLKMENAFLKKLGEVERRREKEQYVKKTDI
jgi:transposase-like protein